MTFLEDYETSSVFFARHGRNWLSTLTTLFLSPYQENPDYVQRANITATNICFPDFLAVGDKMYVIVPMRDRMRFLGKFSL